LIDGVDVTLILKELSDTMTQTSLCGLGQSAATPVVSTLRYFEDEYLEHIEEKKCRAFVCSNLWIYKVLDENCVKCGVCIRKCPVNAISKIENRVIINNKKCTQCGICYNSCKFSAIAKSAKE
jgi:ferredoxin